MANVVTPKISKVVPVPRTKGIVDNNVGSVTPSVIDVPEEKMEELEIWVKDMYDVKHATNEALSQMNEAMSYKGFNRNIVLRQLKQVSKNVQVGIDLVVVTALRGPQAASNIKLRNGRTPKEMGIPASGGQGTNILTLNKIQAATADLAAFYLKKMGAPKRLNMALPGWLQFPSAGSIKLPRDLRDLHLEFSQKFSSLIGGVFQEQIYIQMEANAYLDEGLGLFI